MTKRLCRTGNSLALVIERPLLELAKIDEDTPLDVTTDGDVIIISKIRDGKRERKLKAVVADAHRRYGRVFQELAK
jgi:antitoxin component of MazEF toxin-antitoxin module